MGLQIGKFMSPLGQFVQNQHPSWINKLPNTPVGFGHDGAAPTSNVGIALRGGLPKMGSIRSNYVSFVSNAPTFGEAADGDVVIDANGKTSSGNASKTWGGRFAINPVGNMEIGVSGAIGKVSEELTLLTVVNGTEGDKISRDYNVFGADLMYNLEGVDLKAEYIQQKIGENESSTLEGGLWRAWYAQASYQMNWLRFEPVLRYSDYHNPETNKNQWALGVNYLFSNNVIAKVAYEYNTNEDDLGDASINNNRVSAQLAFGF
ncbi:porin [Sulfurimonas sp. MAG313]|nr:porin [Sulfurimonas sp. MAG313]MDF1880196.1 porin [Sulfurimonas sp. MAG313]